MRIVLFVLILCLLPIHISAQTPPETPRFLVESDSGAVSEVRAKPPNTFISMSDLLIVWYFTLYTGGANFALYDSSDVAVDGDVLTINVPGYTLDWQPGGGGTGWNWSDSSSYGPDTVLVAQQDTAGDDIYVTYIHAAGDTMSGNLSFGGFQVLEAASVVGPVAGGNLIIGARNSGGLWLNRENRPGSQTVIWDSASAKFYFDSDSLVGNAGTVIKGVDSLQSDYVATDTIGISGDVITDFAGTGLSVTAGVLNAAAGHDSTYESMRIDSANIDTLTSDTITTRVLAADVMSADTIIIGTEDTLYHNHISAYFTRIEVHNATGATLDQGTPVYISGATGDIPNADSARADNASMMPAVGTIEHDIANGATGHAVYSGILGNFNTNAWAVGDPIYVQATGGIDTVRPSNGDFVQKIGEVTRVNPSQGAIYIGGAGRTNDLPNAAASGDIFIGGPDSIARSQTVSGDGTLDSAGVLDVIFADSASKVDTTGVVWNEATHALNADSTDAITDGGVDKADLANDALSAMGDSARAAAADTATGIRNGSIWTGVHDFGGATSLEIPNGANPTTDAAGEIAIDSDDDAIEVYAEAQSVSMLMPMTKKLDFVLWNPDLLTDTILFFEVDSSMHPGGIEIVDLSIQMSEDAGVGTYLFELMYFTAADPPVLSDFIDTLVVAENDTRKHSRTFENSTIAIGQQLGFLTHDDDIDWIRVKVEYYVKDND